MSFSSSKSFSNAKLLLSQDEGFEPKRYLDTKGFNTIGFGFNLDTQNLPLPVAFLWLETLMTDLLHNLAFKIKGWAKLNDARKYILLNMAYQMGIGGLIAFHDMLSALADSNYPLAAKEMMRSKWAKEFPQRASRLKLIMISGEF